MPNVDSGFAAWLKDDALFTTTVPGGIAWGERGVAVDFLTAVDTKAEATVEGERIAAFMGFPVVKDAVAVKGQRRDLLGRVVNLTGDRLGYSASATAVFVCGVNEAENGTTVLSVLRKLVPPPNPLSFWTIAADYKTGRYWHGGVTYDETALPGRTYVRTGAKGEQDLSGAVVSFAAGVPGIIPGIGYWSRLALTNALLNAGQASNLATQNVTVTAAARNLSFIGTGTITLSGAATGSLVGTGANDRVDLTFTPAAGTLTLTVTGSVKYAGLVVGTVPGPITPTTGSTAATGSDRMTYVIPPLVDGDMLIVCTAMTTLLSNQTPLSINDGTSTNVINFRWRPSADANVTAGGVVQYNAAIPGTLANQGMTIIQRRLGGAWQLGRILDGVLTWGVSTAGTFPSGMDQVSVGMTAGAAGQLTGPVASLGIRPGTFATDAAVMAAVAEVS